MLAETRTKVAGSLRRGAQEREGGGRAPRLLPRICFGAATAPADLGQEGVASRGSSHRYIRHRGH